MVRNGEEVLEYDNFLDWTVSSLKDFLSLRGFKQTDRKSELVAKMKFPVKGPDIKCFVIYLDFRFNNHSQTKEQRKSKP